MHMLLQHANTIINSRMQIMRILCAVLSCCPILISSRFKDHKLLLLLSVTRSALVCDLDDDDDDGI